MLSNSFHSSTKAHSLSNAGSLAKAERHNDRGYFSFYYDKSKIAQIVGDSSTLAADVERAINDTFNPYVDEYNARQKRKDRKIETSAFEYFCNQKNLDIATEAIFQIGDQEFWSQYRTDTVVHRGKNKYVLHEYHTEVKEVMNEIYGKQIAAFENIYETHGAQIAAAIRKAYDDALAVAQKHEQQHPDFQDIYKTPLKERIGVVDTLDLEGKVAYAEYAAARDTMAAIVKHNTLERVENGQVHIKCITGTGHYDEWSPHVHAISLCWADGFKTGLSSRVSKSVVLNRWALEIIQERLNEIAQEEIAKHPEIFAGETIKPKEKGRNYDYTTEQITRHNLAKLEDRIEATKASERAAEASERQARANALEAQKNASEAQIEANRLWWQVDEEREHLMSLRGAIQSIEEYDFEADELQETIDNTKSMIDNAKELVSCAAPSERKRAAEVFERIAETVRIQLDKIIGVFYRLFGFEEITKMPEKDRRTPSLAEQIENAAARVKDTPWKDDGERYL